MGSEYNYISFFNYILLGITLTMVFFSLVFRKHPKMWLNIEKITGIVLLFFSIIYLGSRDLSIGIDTVNYWEIYDNFSLSNSFDFYIDILFYFPFFLLSKVLSYQIVLYILSFLYIYPIYIASKKLSSIGYIFILLFFFASPFFFQYGINVVRNGIAASLFILAITYYFQGNKKFNFFFLISIGMHISMIIPLCIFTLIRKFNFSVIIVLFIWLLILVFVFWGYSLVSIVTEYNLIIGDRFLGYFSENSNIGISKFRDLLFYSIPAIIFGFVIKKNQLYNAVYLTYILASIVYLLLIDIRHSERVLYLSNFLLPIIFIYPIVNYSNKSQGYSFYLKNIISSLLIFTLILMKII